MEVHENCNRDVLHLNFPMFSFTVLAIVRLQVNNIERNVIMNDKIEENV